MAGASNIHDADEGINEINVVPLVDIMLVLLIIFMVTTQFVADQSEPEIPPPNVPVLLPKAASAEETNAALLSVAINQDRELFLNGEPSSLDGLRSHIGGLRDRGAKLEAFVAADQRLSHGDVIEVIDAIRLLGVADVAIHTRKMEIQ